MTSRPRIVGVVTDGNRRDAKAWEALAACDMAEFRADTMVGPGSGADERAMDLLRAFREEGARRLGKVPETLFTLRLRRDGGEWPDAKASEREMTWRTLAASPSRPCEWVDIETEEVDSLPADLAPALRSAGVKVILSHHDFKGTPGPEGFRLRLSAMEAAKPAAVKFAVTCRTRGEVIDLLAFARETGAGRMAGIFSMGTEGRSTRVLAPLLGCPFTYGYLTGGAVAPGQLSAAELRAFFDGAPFPPSENPETLLNWAEGRLLETGNAR